MGRVVATDLLQGMTSSAIGGAITGALPLTLGVAFLLVLYACIDFAYRGGALDRALERVCGDARAPRVRGVAGLAALLATPLCPHVPGGAALLGRCFAAIGLLVAWNAATRDLDPVTGGPSRAERLLLTALSVAAFWSPLPLILASWLLSGSFRFWQHHATLPMRLLQLGVAFVVALGVSRPIAALGAPELGVVAIERLTQSAILLAFAMQASHYFITAVTKAWIGPRWYSWMLDNRIHYLAASAYSWGWARFLPWSIWARVVRLVRGVEVPLQVSAFALEALSPLVLLAPGLAVGLSVALGLFHLGVFLLSGLLFWDWIAVDLVLAWLAHGAGETTLRDAFGAWPLALGLAVLALFPLRHRLWKPMPLGWYDTPLTQRIQYSVVGASGQVYGLYCDFMCPHERLYGRVNGCFFAPAPVLTYHLGEVWKRELRDAIVQAGVDRAELDRARLRFGVEVASTELQGRHERYLAAFFGRLNDGAAKSVLPPWLSWLKAPGDQIFYFGDLPAYSRQEPVREVHLTYREEVFDGERHVVLVEQRVASIPVGNALTARVAPELLPKELDDFLLARALGRLIDLPASATRYLQGDDGRGPVGAPAAE